jgi:hypothetical protein
MTFTSHVAVGCAVGVATHNPTLGFFAGWASHHIIDSIPHSDPGSFGANIYNVLETPKALVFSIGDLTVGTILFFIVLVHLNFPTFLPLAVAGAILPDFIDNCPFWSPTTRNFPLLKQFHEFHLRAHFTLRAKKYIWIGVVTQLVLITSSLIFIFTPLEKFLTGLT